MMDFGVLLQKISPLIGIALVGLAIAVVHHEVSIYHLQEIKTDLFGLPSHVLAPMIGLTLISYLLLSLYDFLALEYAGEKLLYSKVLLTSFLSFGISNNVGHALLSGGSMRYWLYSSWGISTGSIAKVIAFCTMTYLLGAATILIGIGIIEPIHLIGGQALPSGTVYIVICLAAGLLLTWWGIILLHDKPITLRGHSVSVPSPWLAARQTLLGLTDIFVASLVLFLPLLHMVEMPYSTFILIYMLAQLAGLLSQIPGGLGVFEASFLFLASNQYPASSILAALVAYRVAYYFLPLMFAAPLLAVFELRASGFQWKTTIGKKLEGIESSVPQIFSALLLMGGGILLISGATPGETNRLAWLYDFAPLPLIEFSHLTGSMAGVAMLLLSRAVWKRMDSAYYATIGVLGSGIIASLLKGLDIEEAAILSFMFLLFIPSRRYFYRKSSLLALDYPLEWLTPVAIVIGLSTWLGFFSYKDVEYSNELWWQFSLNGDASRFLRSLVAISVLLCGFGFFRLLTRTNPALELPDDSMLEKAAAIAFQCNETLPHLALLGDKYLLWSETGNSFIMFSTTPSFWIAMGDPIGDASEYRSLVRNFYELADLHATKIAFYQVSARNLPLYRELGFISAMLGEEARVPLQSFSLAGKSKQSLRHAFNKHEREGLTFEIIPANDVFWIIPRLRVISDRWMQHKHAKEKCFSLGFFNESYLRRCDVAVTKSDGRILAFANLWTTEKKEELSLDLMRYEPDSPNGVMEFTMVALMLWGRDQGYKWFNLGMAPLSGLKRQSNTPLWSKIGNTIFHYGSEFYNFEGLYHYKNKFEPVWQPKYLVVLGNSQVAPALLAVTRIISGSIIGVFKK